MKAVLYITGAHQDVLSDIEAVPKVGEREFMAIGLDAVDKYAWPILYMATYHPVEIDIIRHRRHAAGGNTDYKVISHERKPGVDICIEDWWKPSGSSALLGVQAALRMGYTRIVLCGCPLIGQNDKGGKYETFRAGWKERKDSVGPYVRSMSGWTAELLGKPTAEWMRGEA